MDSDNEESTADLDDSISDLEAPDIEDFEDFPQLLAAQLKRRLTVHRRMYLSLSKVNEGYAKKMRFTVQSPCPDCQAINHVRDIDETKEEDCDTCHKTEEFTTKTDVISIYAPMGTSNGSRLVIPDQGNHGPQGIRGDIIIHFFDEPHEHFLRLYDDVLVCLQISHEESTSGFTRLLSLTVPSVNDILVETKENDVIRDNDVRFIPKLGLPNPIEIEKRGMLLIVFFVRRTGSLFPVRWKDVRVASRKRKKSTSDDCSRRNLKTLDADTNKMNGVKNTSPIRSSPGRRRQSLEDNQGLEHSAGSSSGQSSPSRPNDWTPEDPRSSPYERISSPDEHDRLAPSLNFLNKPMERLTWKDIYEEKRSIKLETLSFIDRLIYTRALPLPYKSEPEDPIPLIELEVLWGRKFDIAWWNRVTSQEKLKKDPETLAQELTRDRPKFKKYDCRNAFIDRPVFDIIERKPDVLGEGLKTLSTRHAADSADFLRLRPQELSDKDRLRVLYNLKKCLFDKDS